MTDWSPFGALTVLAIGKRLGLLLAAMAAYGVAAEWAVRGLGLRIPGWGGAAGLINTVILGLLMSFRNRAAYERGWEARGLWGQLTNDRRNLAAKVAPYVPATASAPAGVGAAPAGFAIALKGHLRGERPRLRAISGFEHETDDPPHVPLYLARRLYAAVAGWERDEVIDGATLWVLDPHLRALLAAELSRADSPNFMGDPAGAAEVIGRTCAPQRADRYATLAVALEDLAICEP
jgi:hypothetical protein